MLASLKSFFDNPANNDHTSGGHDIRVATCAILLEMANIDGEFSDDEKSLILQIMQTRFELSSEVVGDLVAEAERELGDSIDLWSFTNRINENYTRQEKTEILECIWTLILADGVTDTHEEYLARKLTNLLRMSHKEFIDAKQKAKSKVGLN